jgi:hypothetical protein
MKWNSKTGSSNTVLTRSKRQKYCFILAPSFRGGYYSSSSIPTIFNESTHSLFSAASS